MCELIYEYGMPYKEFAKLPKHPDVSENVFLFLPKNCFENRISGNSNLSERIHNYFCFSVMEVTITD